MPHGSAKENVPSDAIIRQCLTTLLASEIFEGSRRLQEFLIYVVEEKLAGREKSIKGKTIAEDVYGRTMGGALDYDSVVRVDGSRLRRRLDQYYSKFGQQDAIRIEIPKGSYVPQFSSHSIAAEFVREQESDTLKKALIVFIGLLLVVAVAALFWTQILDVSNLNQENTLASANIERNTSVRIELERRAMFEKSPASLQAYNYAQQGRELSFPPLDPVQRQIALQLFKRSISSDPEYFGGYAGAAQIFAFSAFLSNPVDEKMYLENARLMSQKAQDLGPMRAWVQSSLAWVDFVSREYDRAMSKSNLAYSIDPSDNFVRIFHGMMLVFNGDFEEAIQVIHPYVYGTNELSPRVHRNIATVAYFHSGKYLETIDMVENITDQGGASSPLIVAYLVASFQALGDHDKAKELAADMISAWPDFPFDTLFKRIFRNKEHAEEVLVQIRAAGWEAADRSQ